MNQEKIDELSDIMQGREPFPFCQCYKAKEMPFVSPPNNPESNIMGLYRYVGKTQGLHRYACGMCGNIVKIMDDPDGWDVSLPREFLQELIDKWRGSI